MRPSPHRLHGSPAGAHAIAPSNRISGFVDFAGTCVPRLRARCRAVPRRACSTAAAAPARTWRCSRSSAKSFGFDLTWNGLVLARTTGRRNVARASIGSIPFASGHFDVVTSFDVFQCLPDVVERDAAREMWRVLKPGGHAILNVAALEILSGGHAVLSEEVRRYTPQRLRSVFESAGFRRRSADVCACHAAAGDAAGATVAALAERRNAAGRRVRHHCPAGAVNGLFTALVGLEAAALRVANMPIGSSLLLHARKPERLRSQGSGSVDQGSGSGIRIRIRIRIRDQRPSTVDRRR